MKRWMGLALAATVIVGPGAARAQSADGHAALALGSIVGSYSPRLSAAQKGVLAHYLASKPNLDAHAAPIQVNAASVTCGASNVDVTRFFCDLKIGTSPVRHLTGRAANELYATLGEAGVQDDGAAGTIYHGVTTLHCVLTPADIAQSAGGGASCTYTPA
jgi:hypothetical protein